jgi:hypothetical protein
MTLWVEDVCRIPEAFNERLLTRLSLFNVAADHLGNRDEFVGVVAGQLERTPSLVDAWRWYSQDKRGSGGPYFGTEADPLEVGRYRADDGASEAVQHSSAVDACADFIYREAVWVIRRA